MPGKIEHRSVTPLLQIFRAFLRGKDHTNALRFADEQAARTQPQPDIPGGPYHKTTKIYYYTRDARREVKPPTVVVPTLAQLETGIGATGNPKYITPGKVFVDLN